MEISNRNYFSTIPNEIKQEVFSHLPLRSVLLAQLVCQSWRDVVSDPFFWKNYEIKIEGTSDHLLYSKYKALLFLIRGESPENESQGFALAEKYASEIAKKEVTNSLDKLLVTLTKVRYGGTLHPGEIDFTNFPSLRKMAEEGNRFALYVRALSNYKLKENDLCVFSLEGEEALSDLRKAAEKGLDAALYFLSMFDLNALSDLEDRENPEALFFRIAMNGGSLVLKEKELLKEGNHWMLYTLAKLSKTKKERLNLALKAAMQDNLLAQFFVGKLSEEYKSMQLEEEEVSWLSNADKAGENLPYFYFGKLCKSNEHLLDDTEKEFADLFSPAPLALENGWIFNEKIKRLRLLHRIYKKGIFVKKNDTKAAEYFFQVKAICPMYTGEGLRESKESSLKGSSSCIVS